MRLMASCISPNNQEEEDPKPPLERKNFKGIHPRNTGFPQKILRKKYKEGRKENFKISLLYCSSNQVDSLSSFLAHSWQVKREGEGGDPFLYVRKSSLTLPYNPINAY